MLIVSSVPAFRPSWEAGEMEMLSVLVLGFMASTMAVYTIVFVYVPEGSAVLKLTP